MRRGEITTDYAIAEVNRTYKMYMERQRAQVPQPVAQPRPVQSQPQPMVQPQLQSMAQTKPVQPRPAQPVWALQPIPQTPYGQQPPQMQNVQEPQWQQVSQPAPKKDMEFAIGAGLFGVVGVLFVLVAFVMLGLTYMSGMVKGLCLYAIALAVLAISELILTKKIPKFAVGITGLGICGLYLATMLNYLYLENFNGIVALIIAIGAVVAGFVIKEKALRITGLSLTMVVCVKIVLYDFAELENVEKMVLFLIVGLIVLAISGIYIALEKKIV